MDKIEMKIYGFFNHLNNDKRALKIWNISWIVGLPMLYISYLFIRVVVLG